MYPAALINEALATESCRFDPHVCSGRNSVTKYKFR